MVNFLAVNSALIDIQSGVGVIVALWKNGVCLNDCLEKDMIERELREENPHTPTIRVHLESYMLENLRKQ